MDDLAKVFETIVSGVVRKELKDLGEQISQLSIQEKEPMDEFLSIKRTMEFLGCKKDYAYNLSKKIPVYALGGLKFYKKSDLIREMEKNKLEPGRNHENKGSSQTKIHIRKPLRQS